METYIMGAINKLIERYRTKKGLKIVVDVLEDSIRSSFTTSKILKNDLWQFYRKRFIDLAKRNTDDVEMAGVVCGFESFIIGFLMGEGYKGNDIMNELGNGKWKQYIDKSMGVRT